MKFKNKGILLLILISFLFLTACDGGSPRLYDVTIWGKVTDNATGEPVKDARVYINSVYKGKTDIDGLYIFNDSIRYISTLKVTRPGYITETRRITAIEDGEVSNYDFILKRKDEDFYGTIKGRIMYGNPKSRMDIMSSSDDNPYSKVIAVATKKEGNIYYKRSNSATVDKEGIFEINNVKINEDLRLIAWIDNNRDGYIGSGDYFEDYHETIRLTENNFIITDILFFSTIVDY